MPTSAEFGRTRQVVFPRAGTIELHDDVVVPEVGDDEVIVRVARVGICATDLHLLDGHIGDPFPLVPGHEFVGEVAAIGLRAAEARRLEVGDHVAVEMLLPCRACARCREGRYNLCERDDMALGLERGRQYGVNIPRTVSPGLWGGYAEYLYAPAEAVIHWLPPELPWDRAVLVEPLAVAFHAIARARIAPGENVAVLGPGPVGLLAAAAARTAGAGRVIMVGTRPSRLAVAWRFGADDVIDARAEDDLAGAVQTAMAGHRPDVVIEVVGTASAQQDAIRLVRRGGRAVLAGACGADVPVTVLADEDLLTREVDVLPSFLSSGGFEPAIAQLSRHDFAYEELVTHRFALEQVADAFDLARTRADGVIKAVLDPRLSLQEDTHD